MAAFFRPRRAETLVAVLGFAVLAVPRLGDPATLRQFVFLFFFPSTVSSAPRKHRSSSKISLLCLPLLLLLNPAPTVDETFPTGVEKTA